VTELRAGQSGLDSRQGQRLFHWPPGPDRLRGSPSLLSSGYLVLFPRGKPVGTFTPLYIFMAWYLVTQRGIFTLFYFKSRDSSVSIALGYGLDDRCSRVRFPAGLRIFLFTTTSRTALGPTQPPIQWVPGALHLGVKLPRRESDRSLPSSAQVKERLELYLHSPNTSSWRGTQLKKSTGKTLL
jgi:hypothetical protein